MTSMNSTETTAPIDDFSECHAGIVAHLNQLDSLVPLLEPAMKARRPAAEAVRFFRSAVFEHHNDEERELFPAVLANAAPGEERDRVKAVTDRLVREHRNLESLWSKLEPELQAVARRWKSLVDEFTGGNREIAKNVRAMYDVEHAQINAVQPNTPDPAMFAFMSKVFATIGGGPG